MHLNSYTSLQILHCTVKRSRSIDRIIRSTGCNVFSASTSDLISDHFSVVIVVVVVVVDLQIHQTIVGLSHKVLSIEISIEAFNAAGYQKDLPQA